MQKSFYVQKTSQRYQYTGFWNRNLCDILNRWKHTYAVNYRERPLDLVRWFNKICDVYGMVKFYALLITDKKYTVIIKKKM